MRLIELPWETWRAVIDALRAKELPHTLDHADSIERQRDPLGPDEPTAALHLTDDVYLRSFNGSRVQLGRPLPPVRSI